MRILILVDRIGLFRLCKMLVLLLGFAPFVQAGTVALVADRVDYELGYYLEWIRDPNGTLDIETVQSIEAGQWIKSNSAVPNLGYLDDAVWFRINLHNQDAVERWYLVINYPLIRSLDVYFFQKGELVRFYQTGDRFEFSVRPVMHRDFIFPLALAPQQDLEVYFRIKNHYSMQLPLRLMDERRMLEVDSLVATAHGLFFGFVLVLSIYNLFLFVGTHERTYLYYVLFSVSIGVFQLVQQGYAFQLLWPREVAWQNLATALTVHLSLFTSFLFVSEFLGLRAGRSVVYRLLKLIAWCAGLTFVLAPWIDEFYVMRIGVLLSVPACLLAMIGGWFSWRDGRSDARIFTLAWGIFLLGILFLALNKLGIVPRNFLTEHGAEIGTVIELSMLAFALASRINHERSNRERLERQTLEFERAASLANERALELERLNNQYLERSVSARTEDLQQALVELSNMSNRLEEARMQDPVTGVGNENSFLKALDLEWDRAFRNHEELSLIVVELDEYRDLIANQGQVAAEETLKSVALILERTISRPADVVTRYGDKVFGVVLPATDMMGAQSLAERVVQKVKEKPFDFGICQVFASISIGIASACPQKQGGYRELLLAAESAVSVAKNQGGGQIRQAGDSGRA